MPKLLKLRTDINTTRGQDVNALLVIDKELRGSGTTAKTPAVFSFYDVRIYICNAIICNCPDYKMFLHTASYIYVAMYTYKNVDICMHAQVSIKSPQSVRRLLNFCIYML